MTVQRLVMPARPYLVTPPGGWPRGVCLRIAVRASDDPDFRSGRSSPLRISSEQPDPPSLEAVRDRLVDRLKPSAGPPPGTDP